MEKAFIEYLCLLLNTLCSGLVVVAGLDDLVESGLERSTTDKESIDVLLLNEIGSVSIADRATVKDPDRLRCLLGDVSKEPLADLGMSLLSDLGGGSKASTDGPDGLVGNDDLGPVLALLSNSVQLSRVDGLGLARLTLLLLLTDAGKHGHAVVQSDLGLLSNIRVSLAVERSSLGVAGKGPADAGVLDHGTGELAGESTIASQREVLGSNVHVVANSSLHGGQVKGSGGDHDINLGGIELEVVEDLSREILGESHSSIALPVAADEVSSHFKL